MKIKVNAASWKKAVAKANSLDAKSINPNESCTKIHIEENNSYLFVVESSSHNTKIVLNDIEIIEEGSCYIQTSSLDSLTKTIFSKEINIEVKDNKLIYEIDKLGAIYEPLFHNQSPFHGMVFAPENYTLIEEGETPFTKLLKSGISAFIDKDKASLDVLLSAGQSALSGNISLGGGLIYLFDSTSETKFRIRIDLLKNVLFILEDLSTFKLEKGINTIKLSSSRGESILGITELNSSSLNYLINTVFKAKEESSVLIKSEELINAIKWQGYSSKEDSCFILMSEKDKFLVKGEKTEEPSILEYNESTPFNKLTLTKEGLSKAILTLPKDSLITLKTVLVEVINQADPIKTALICLEGEDYTSISYLQEPATHS